MYEYGKPFFVITGNLSEFHYYRRCKMDELNLIGKSVQQMDFRYVGHPHAFRGHQDISGAFYGTWRTRSDIVEIIKELSHIQRSKALPTEAMEIFLSR
jgi:hypothetical protein